MCLVRNSLRFASGAVTGRKIETETQNGDETWIFLPNR